MTDEEKKAAAAKAEAEKKAAEDEANKKVAKGDDEEEDDETEKDDSPEKLKAALKKANDESKKRRLELKELKEKQEKQDKALAILQGKDGKGDIDPVLQAKKEADSRLARSLIKAELGSLARDAHDTNALFRAHSDKFKDIEVDFENESVDKDTLKERVDEIRKSDPWMFQSKGTNGVDEVIVKKNPDKTGLPGGGGSEFKEWQKLKGSGDMKSAQAFYAKNRDKILTQMGK